MSERGSSSPLAPGSAVGRYAVVSRIGSGGMGEVFLAHDTSLDRKVALKVLSPLVVGDHDHLVRFQREARHLAGLNHPNIVTVFSVEEVNGHYVLAMEYVDGHTLRRLIAPGGVALERCLEIAVALADAVAAAHDRGIVHRDLKPENVMVNESGRLKVLDFGLAKAGGAAHAVTAASGATVTRHGVVLGTLPYMSPEQIDGRPTDQRTDIFSLGIILYELLAGERPFKGESGARVLSSILLEEPPQIAQVRADVPEGLARLVHLCLQKDASARLQSAAALRDELSAVLHGIRFGTAPAASHRAVAPRGLADLRRWAEGLVSLRTRVGLTALLAATLAFNWIETAIETTLRNEYQLGQALGYEIAAVMSWLEQGITFERHDLTSGVGIYAASIAYFAVPPVLGLFTAFRLAADRRIGPYRTFVFSIVITYALSLACFLVFPVPERWAFPESEAVLLSDLWSTALIEALRPISGLDNSFPSFHVASAVVVALLWFVYGLRYRYAVAFLSVAVILSTFMLGIHWVPDMIAGAALGVLSVWLALRLTGESRPVESHADALTTSQPIQVASNG
jgi:membrane-associated phospholipid phosphatase